MQYLIGKHEEIKMLTEYVESNKSEFIAIYGRRRVGKTFLIKQFFDNKFSFQATGIANMSEKQQLILFHTELERCNENKIELIPETDFAFYNLRLLLETLQSKQKKKIFPDALPWLAKGKNFIPALEHF